jgi:hypothetical protein
MTRGERIIYLGNDSKLITLQENGVHLVYRSHNNKFSKVIIGIFSGAKANIKYYNCFSVDSSEIMSSKQQRINRIKEIYE